MTFAAIQECTYPLFTMLFLSIVYRGLSVEWMSMLGIACLILGLAIFFWFQKEETDTDTDKEAEAETETEPASETTQNSDSA